MLKSTHTHSTKRESEMGTRDLNDTNLRGKLGMNTKGDNDLIKQEQAKMSQDPDDGEITSVSLQAEEKGV